MTKYIDAEKLIALLEQRKKQLAQWVDTEYANQRIDEIDCILDVDIDSLQQEQSEVDLEKEIDMMADSVPCRKEDIEYIVRHFYDLKFNARKK